MSSLNTQLFSIQLFLNCQRHLNFLLFPNDHEVADPRIVTGFFFGGSLSQASYGLNASAIFRWAVFFAPYGFFLPVKSPQRFEWNFARLVTTNRPFQPLSRCIILTDAAFGAILEAEYIYEYIYIFKKDRFQKENLFCERKHQFLFLYAYF